MGYYGDSSAYESSLTLTTEEYLSVGTYKGHRGTYTYYTYRGLLHRRNGRAVIIQEPQIRDDEVLYTCLYGEWCLPSAPHGIYAGRNEPKRHKSIVCGHIMADIKEKENRGNGDTE